MESVTYSYDDIVHDHSGKQVPCRNCDRLVYITHVPSMGCPCCSVEPAAITIELSR